MIDSTIVRTRHCAACARRGLERGSWALKRGFTSKVHLRANGGGLPFKAETTDGPVSDNKGYEPVMEGALDPAVLLADRGYDADRIR